MSFSLVCFYDFKGGITKIKYRILMDQDITLKTQNMYVIISLTICVTASKRELFMITDKTAGVTMIIIILSCQYYIISISYHIKFYLVLFLTASNFNSFQSCFLSFGRTIQLTSDGIETQTSMISLVKIEIQATMHTPNSFYFISQENSRAQIYIDNATVLLIYIQTFV